MKFIGYFLVALPFLGLLVMSVKTIGWQGTAIVSGITIAIVLCVVVGVTLIMGK